MKAILNILLAAAFCLILTACGTSTSGDETVPSAAPRPTQQITEPESAEPDPSENTEPMDPAASPAGIPVTVTVGEQVFPATLQDSETARQLAERLPLTLDMSELNGNEKYFYLDSGLPTDSCQLRQINAGDLMLYGDSCLVLFYKTFSSGYSYTPLGSVDDPTGLAEALGTGSVTVTFSIEK